MRMIRAVPVLILGLLPLEGVRAQDIGSWMNWNNGNIYGMGVMSTIQTDRAARGSGQANHSSRNIAVRSSALPDATMEKLKRATLEVLEPEFQRRARTEGLADARSWGSRTLTDIGQQVGRLGGEYRRRVTANGRNSADNWYVGQTRQIASRYLSALAGVQGVQSAVPAATMRRVEDAVYAVLEPEINQRSTRQGTAYAQSWARSAGVAIGNEVQRLKPEYIQRAQDPGTHPTADQWIVTQAREIATRYVNAQRQ